MEWTFKGECEQLKRELEKLQIANLNQFVDKCELEYDNKKPTNEVDHLKREITKH